MYKVQLIFFVWYLYNILGDFVNMMENMRRDVFNYGYTGNFMEIKMFHIHWLSHKILKSSNGH